LKENNAMNSNPENIIRTSNENKTNQIKNNFKLEKSIIEQLISQNQKTETIPSNQNAVSDMEKLEELKNLIEYSNSNPQIRNKIFIETLLENEKLSESLNSSKTYAAPKFFVILIQIHSRVNYLKELVESLRKTVHINETLVIFSHDVYMKEMNEIVEAIDFCATLQIFYPFSIQLYPNKFPGEDPNDCQKINKQEYNLFY